MKTISAKASFLFAPLLCSALALAQDQPPVPPTPKLNYCGISWSDAASQIGFQINVRGNIADAGLAHRYEVRYQLRLHTQKGVEGPLLGDEQMPNGRAFVLGEAEMPDVAGVCSFNFIFDLTRKDLDSMTQLREGRMVLRVEPQIYDLTAKTYITPVKSDALIAVLDVGKTLRVWSVVPFAKWFGNSYGESTAGPALELLASLDALDYEGNAIVPAFEEVLRSEHIKPAELLLVLEALPAKELAFGKNNLRGIITGLAEHKDAAVRAAAVEKQKQADALQPDRQ